MNAVLVKSVMWMAIGLIVAAMMTFYSIAAGQSAWNWTDTIRPVSQSDIGLVVPRACEGEENCATWNTYQDGPGTPITMTVACATDGVSVIDGSEVYSVPMGIQMVAAFTVRPCVLETPTPTPTETSTPEPTQTPTPEPTSTPTPLPTETPTLVPEPTEVIIPDAPDRPWATEGWASVVRPVDESIVLSVRSCEGEANCWTWQYYADNDAHPIWVEAKCAIDGEHVNPMDGNVYRGVPKGVQFILGFTARPCKYNNFLPTILRH